MAQELQADTKFFDLDSGSDLILQKDRERIYIARGKLWALEIDYDPNAPTYSTVMVTFPDTATVDKFVTEHVIDYGYTVDGGLMKDQISVYFND